MMNANEAREMTAAVLAERERVKAENAAKIVKEFVEPAIKEAAAQGRNNVDIQDPGYDTDWQREFAIIRGAGYTLHPYGRGWIKIIW